MNIDLIHTIVPNNFTNKHLIESWVQQREEAKGGNIRMRYEDGTKEQKSEADCTLAHFINRITAEKQCGQLGKIRSDWDRAQLLHLDMDSILHYFYHQYVMDRIRFIDTWKTDIVIVDLMHFNDQIKNYLDMVEAQETFGNAV